MLPDRTLGFKNQESKGFKMNKKQITLLLCTNKTGSHKLKPLVIGRSKQPRCFHHVNLNNLPVLYRNSKNSWMRGDIFENWFFDEFVPAARKHMRKQKMEEKVCLLVDNCPAHPSADILQTADGKIKVYFLPKNTMYSKDTAP